MERPNEKCCVLKTLILKDETILVKMSIIAMYYVNQD